MTFLPHKTLRRSRGSYTRRTLQFQQCEPRNMLTRMVDVGDLASGIAVSDDASGAGYVLYSEENVHTRFADLLLENSDHLVAVRFHDDVWQYNNDTVWVDFDAAENDVLLANVDFEAGVIRPFEGTVSEGTVRPIGGVEMGYLDGNLHFFANQWNGQSDAGEIGVIGSYFSLATRDPTPATSIERLRNLGLAMLNIESATTRLPAHAIYSADGEPCLVGASAFCLTWGTAIFTHSSI